MKIGSSHDGVLFGTRGRTVGAWQPETGFEPRGRLPNPDVPFTGKQQVNYGPLNRWWVKRLVSTATGWYTTSNVWPIDADTLLATVGPSVYRSGTGGEAWQQVYELPLESGPMGTLPTSFCTDGDRVFLAEYTFGDVPARILTSRDAGRTWTTFFESLRFRHFHGVFHDPYADRLWATTGDTDAESTIGFFEAETFHEIGGGSQRWRSVGLAFTPDSVFWGMDCSYADAVQVFRLPRDELGSDEAQPRVVTVVDSSVFYLETLAVDGEHWIVLSTAAEVGLDDTAPPGSQNASSDTARVLAASSRSDYETWYELGSFDRRRAINEYLPKLPTASSYVFLEADEEFGLAINPFNVTAHNGDVLSVSAERFAALDRSRSVDEVIREKPAAITRGDRSPGSRPGLPDSAPEVDVAK